MSDRPKESYLAWFREILANYKIIAMIVVLLGGYSGVNLWEDYGKAFNAPKKALNAQENPIEYSPLGHAHESEGIGAFANALNDHIKNDHIPDHADLHQ